MIEQVEVKKVDEYKSWEKPPCFTNAKQFREYIELVKTVRQPADANNYCLDCTAKYQQDMISEGRCDHPETRFVKWRTTVKQRGADGIIVVKRNEVDIVGISNTSRFWGSPSLD
jgi:hypothetical protein